MALLQSMLYIQQKLLDEQNNPLEVAYVLFTLKIIDGSVQDAATIIT